MTAVASMSPNKRAKMASLTTLPADVQYETTLNGNLSKTVLKVKGEIVIEKSVEMGPIQTPGPRFEQAHHTTVFAMGEEILTTTLHMKMCVHFENKEYLDQALKKLAGALGASCMTQALWDEFVNAANAKEVQGLYEYVYTQRLAMPLQCNVLPFC